MSILKLVTRVVVVGSKRFVADKDSLKEANIGYTGTDFDQFFLGKVEEDVKDATLAIHTLQKGSLDRPIREELGQEREETTLAHFFTLLKKQSKGEQGDLLANGCVNVAYIKDKNGSLSAVCAFWGSGDRCWSVSAGSGGGPGGWPAGRQVISCDC